MDFKDYYATLGVERTATHDEIRRAYRKLARKYHPDVSEEPDAEERFKEVAEAHEALIDLERRAAYDEVVRRHENDQNDGTQPGWDSGFEFSGRAGEPGSGQHGGADFSEFFSSLFGNSRHANGSGGSSAHGAQGDDRHARIVIDLDDAYRGAHRTITLQVPVVDPQGRVSMHERQLEVNIPRGVREGQHLRLAGQGGPGYGDAPAGDLYLEIALRAHARFRVEKGDVYFDLPLAPWEAALGATVIAATPEGEVQLTIPAHSVQGRKLRLKGKGLPGKHPGDLYAVLGIALPSSASPEARAAYEAMAHAFAQYNPRSAMEA
jgi:curved DNA-binding protein